MPEETLVDTSTNLVQDEGQVADETAEYENYRANRGKQPEAEKAPEPEPVVAQDAEAQDKGEEAEPAEDKGEHRPSGYKRLKLKVAELEAKLAERAEKPNDPDPVPHPDGKPRREDYTDDNDWEEDVYRWRKAREATENRLKAHNARLAEAAKTHGDAFEEAMEVVKTIRAFDSTVEAVADSPLSAEITFHLGKDPKEAARFSAMSAAAQLVEIGRIEAKLANAREAKADPKAAPKTVKPPPKPITPLSGGKTAGSSATSWMESEDYEVYWAGRKRAAEARR